jgi:uncharacterized protein (DUF302 family)
MKTKFIWVSLALVYSLTLFAEEKPATPTASTNDPIISQKVSDDFETTKENIEMAVTDKGLRVSGTLHVSEMLNRTGKDLGFDKQIFAKAESVEFCSALISHKMAVADPANISVCPFTIAVYSYTEKPEQVYVSYRLPELIGNATEVTKEIQQLFLDIVTEATE